MAAFGVTLDDNGEVCIYGYNKPDVQEWLKRYKKEVTVSVRNLEDDVDRRLYELAEECQKATADAS